MMIRMLTRGRWATIVPYLLLALLCLPALWPMWTLSFWASHDGLHHIFRIANFDAGLRDGAWYPRWADGLGFGYGFPVTHYYAPLAYFIAEFFHLNGFGILDSIKLTYVCGFIISAWAMFLLARDVMGVGPALLAAIVYAYYPYHIADVYMRGTLSEFFALAWLPLIVWSARRCWMSENGNRRTEAGRSAEMFRRVRARLGSYLNPNIFLTLSLAALILTHNLSAFLFLPVLIFYLLLSNSLQWRGWLSFGYSLVLAFALSAFYWLPAISEVSWIRAGQISDSVDEIASVLTPLSQFISFTLFHPYVPDAPASLQHPLSLPIAFLSACAIGVAWRWRARLALTQRREWLVWFIVAGLMVFAMTDGSAFIWANLRALNFVQFPYRLHAMLGLALAMLIGFGLESSMADDRRPRANDRRPQTTDHRPKMVVRPASSHQPSAIHNQQSAMFLSSLIALTILLIVVALGSLTLVPQALPDRKEPLTESQINRQGMSDYDYQTALWARLHGGPWLLEYLPAWVTAGREEFFLPLKDRANDAPPPIAAQVMLHSHRSEQRVLQMQSAEQFTLSFHTFYFPAWQIRVDGQAVPTFPSGSLALVSADVPAGNHTVTLAWEATRWQRVGEWLAGLSGLLVVAIGVWHGRRSARKILWGALFVGICLLLTLTWMRIPAPPNVQTVSANFADAISLLGYQTSHTNLRAGQTIELTLYWFARQTPAEDFKIFIHLDGEAGVGGRVGQADAQPGFNFSPTTRWQRGEIVADHYRVKIADNAVPGDYELFTGIYRQRPVQNLRVVSAQAVPGDRVRLGVVTVVR